MYRTGRSAAGLLCSLLVICAGGCTAQLRGASEPRIIDSGASLADLATAQVGDGSSTVFDAGPLGDAGPALDGTARDSQWPRGDSRPPNTGGSISLTLINADNEQPIASHDPLEDRATIDLALLPTRNLNIRANAGGSDAVAFTLSGAESHSKTERAEPYALMGDSFGDYNAWTPTVGSYTLVVRQGAAAHVEIKFTVVDSGEAGTDGGLPDASSQSDTGSAGTDSAANVDSGGSNPAINFPGGMVAISHDGNQHDSDDWGALAMNGALWWAAGLQQKIVHIDHSSHLGDNNSSMHQEMIASATGVVARFGVSSAVVFDAQSQLAEAIANFKQHADQATASNPLWYILSGPMEVAYRCISAVDPAKRQNIHIISHSSWNDEHADTSLMTHTWSDVAALGVVAHKILDQNFSNGDDDFNTPRDRWSWLQNSSYEPYRWVHSRDSFSDKFDVSDAGMSYWLISGGPNGGNQRAGWAEAKLLLEAALPN
ncbi:MAG: hypothetical protein H6707_15340 [Deltaproteobacteria bacterium]|nr:hypothetical protein [Deltaproteobacteria bacterium]